MALLNYSSKDKMMTCTLCNGNGFIPVELRVNIPRYLLAPLPPKEFTSFDMLEVRDFLFSLLHPDEFGYSVSDEVKTKVRSLLKSPNI